MRNGYEQVAPNISCMDRWPSGTFNDRKRKAYATLETKGAVKIISMRQGRISGVTIVRYVANCPQEWILQQLAREAHIEPVQMQIGAIEQ
ncbi:MAG: hypothetical protein ACOX63_10160 [Christensenellales bacterium]|jgi:hypothetical protein